MEHAGYKPGKVAIGIMVAIGLLIPLLVTLALISGFQLPLSGTLAGSQVAEKKATSPPVSPQTPTFEFQAQDKTTPWALVSNGVSNPTIKVRVGDSVKITFTNTGQAPHTWTLDANSPSPYDVSTIGVPPGKSETISFVADKPGTFTYYCKVPGHKELGMKGTIIVEQ